jgi:excinuclease UvrABC ATPase subunit
MTLEFGEMVMRDSLGRGTDIPDFIGKYRHDILSSAIEFIPQQVSDERWEADIYFVDGKYGMRYKHVRAFALSKKQIEDLKDAILSYKSETETCPCCCGTGRKI